MNRVLLSKLITSITLICYLAVASVAAAHAFPTSGLGSRGGQVQTIDADVSMVEPNCHEGQSFSKVSVCKMFCAATSSVIVKDVAPMLTMSIVRADIEFLSSDLSTREPALEPHPPK